MKASHNSKVFREGQELFYTGKKKTNPKIKITPVRESLRLLHSTKKPKTTSTTKGHEKLALWSKISLVCLL